MTRVIAFLGSPHNLKETSYNRNETGGLVTSCFSAYAVHHLYNAAETLVFCTPEASKTFCNMVKAHQGAEAYMKKIDIENAVTEQDMWKVFEKLTQHIAVGEELIFDMTSGFRSVPFLVSTALRYLQKVRNVKIRHVLYAMFDSNSETTPIIELNPFLELQDWVDAAHTFKKYGHGKELADRVAALNLPYGNQVEAAIRNISSALHLVHVIPLSRFTAQLIEITTQHDFVNNMNTAPFSDILRSVVSDFKLFKAVETPRDELLRLKSVLQWYLDHQLPAQAVLLAMEWLQCYVIYQDYRDLNNAEVLALFRNKPGNLTTDGCLGHIQGTDVAYEIRQMRNTTAHAYLNNNNPHNYNAVEKIHTYCQHIMRKTIPGRNPRRQ